VTRAAEVVVMVVFFGLVVAVAMIWVGLGRPFGVGGAF
jgi:hypothetical protein